MMTKQLSELSLEELWDLFPVILKEHNPRYKDWYEEEKQKIIKALKKDIIRINHIGSTAVPGLISKPTVDILLEIDGNCHITELINIISSMGWQLMSQNNDPLNLSFNKGYSLKGYADKVYHLHIRYAGDYNELYFKDYLIKHPDIAQAYGELKLKLLKEYKHNRDGYTKAKTAFIQKYSQAARKEFLNRYKPK